MFAPHRPDEHDTQPALTADQAKVFTRVRRLMTVSALATLLGIAVILIVIGYRLYRNDGTSILESTDVLPEGARVIATAVSGERILVTVAIGDTVEIRTYDARTLRRQGRLRLSDRP
jgi:Family of unknown function (DUF6476)